MPPSAKKKRHSAFEDFNNHEEQQFEDKLPETFATDQPEVERIERLKPSEMIPDRFQPRRLLPARIRKEFFNGKINCYEAAEKWLALSRKDRGYQAQINRLIEMGSSFDEHGQIKPITGSWITRQDGSYQFQIETGERRFWACCLNVVLEKKKEEPSLRVEVVTKPTRQRQVIENRHAEPPSAVGQACEIASLILSELNIQPEEDDDEFNYFRKARSQRMPAGLWESVTPIMQLTRPRMVQLLNILQLPTPLLELADRYRLPERVLREILAMPSDEWESLLQASIHKNLTSDDVAEITGRREDVKREVKPSVPKKQKAPEMVAISGLRRFTNAVKKLDGVHLEQVMDELANELVSSGDAKQLVELLEELNRLIKARITRM